MQRAKKEADVKAPMPLFVLVFYLRSLHKLCQEDTAQHTGFFFPQSINGIVKHNIDMIL